MLGDMHPVLARVYARRGVASAEELNLSLAKLLPAGDMLSMDVAAKRVVDAIERDERIVIVGDFDADGATATAILIDFLRRIGHLKLGFLVPNRFDFGYGLTPPIVDIAQQDGAELIITVDNGIASVDGVERAREHGIDVVVTDHHLPGLELPDAIIVNPNQDGCAFASKNLAGCGVAFYLATAVRRMLREADFFASRDVAEPNLATLLDLVALGTVADVVPLDYNNRILIEQGLRRMRAGLARPGIAALLQVANRSSANLTAGDLAFAVAPRLNAAGRLEDMSIGIRCLLAEEPRQARELATALDELNRTRRAIEADMVAQAELAASAYHNVDPDRSGVCLFDESWHQGVVGIVAGRIRERLHRPVIAFAEAGDMAPDELKGSARSLPGFHMRDALDLVAKEHPGLIRKFGGHAMAAGLTIKRVHFDRLASAFADIAKRLLTEDMLAANIVTDGSLEASEVDMETAELLRRGGPWGQHFPEPCFDNEVVLVNRRTVGEKHERLTLKIEDRVAAGIYFNFPYASLGAIKAGDRLRCVYRLDVNEYRNQRSLQLMVEHMEPAG
ncbi:MAG: single-stranded-DNA-specific exonuclease RecJ [Pseudomonadaceae bacterium]|nr:single-stranded-DNA-specific exonuclease RecJ [Pseudomonadaceae bacterium]